MCGACCSLRACAVLTATAAQESSLKQQLGSADVWRGPCGGLVPSPACTVQVCVMPLCPGNVILAAQAEHSSCISVATSPFGRPGLLADTTWLSSLQGATQLSQIAQPAWCPALTPWPPCLHLAAASV